LAWLDPTFGLHDGGRVHGGGRIARRGVDSLSLATAILIPPRELHSRDVAPRARDEVRPITGYNLGPKGDDGNE